MTANVCSDLKVATSGISTSGSVWGRRQATECSGRGGEGVEIGGREEDIPKHKAQKQRQKRNQGKFERALVTELCPL